MAYADGYLCVLTPGDGGIHAFRVNDDGSLAATAAVTGALPVQATGLAAW